MSLRRLALLVIALSLAGAAPASAAPPGLGPNVVVLDPSIIMTVNLDAGTIDHVVDGVGAAADTTKVGQPVFVVDYP